MTTVKKNKSVPGRGAVSPSPSADQNEVMGPAFNLFAQHVRLEITRVANSVLLKALGIMSFGFLVCVVLVAIGFSRTHETLMMGITDDLRVVPVAKLDDNALYTRDRIQNWAVRAIPAVWQFDYHNYRDQILGATSDYFTEAGAREFQAVLERQDILRTVIDEYRVVSMVFENPPIVTAETPGTDGLKAWRVSARATINLRSVSDTRKLRRNVTVVVVKTPEGAARGKLLAISQYLLTPV